jgi:hypothetical protein
MEWIGLFFEFTFLALGVYVYLFSRGLIQFSNPDHRAKAEAFREQNKSWMRILSLGLIAIMSINIFLHITQLLS